MSVHPLKLGIRSRIIRRPQLTRNGIFAQDTDLLGTAGVFLKARRTSMERAEAETPIPGGLDRTLVRDDNASMFGDTSRCQP
jgi:hypothetical protein